MTLLIVSFLAGVLTTLTPCVLPMLPVILGESISGGFSLRRALTVILSLALSIIGFTFLLKVSTAFIAVPPQVWWWLSGGILIVYGSTLIYPWWAHLSQKLGLSVRANKSLGDGFLQHSTWGDVVVGLSLGPVFSTCSPTYFVILASILPVSFWLGVTYLLAYVAGLSIMLLVIALLGQRIVTRFQKVISYRWFDKSIGALFIIIGILVATGSIKRIELNLSHYWYDFTKTEQCLLGYCGGTASDRPLENPFEKKSAGAERVKAPELTGIAHFLNSDPFTFAQYLDGKHVILVDFWTYGCINCQRGIPKLNELYEKYKDRGLVVVGIHTPEFAYEKQVGNVQNALATMEVRYPVVLDNDMATWRAFANNYWPRKYLIDKDGYIIYDHIGEGGYAKTEAAIEAALAAIE